MKNIRFIWFIIFCFVLILDRVFGKSIIGTEYGHAENHGASYVRGGTAVHIHTFPFTAVLKFCDKTKCRIMCGGTIISDRHILTAAHCVQKPVTVVTGSSYHTAGGETHKVRKTTIHPKYNRKRGLDYDVAVLTLERPIKYNFRQKPINLPKSPAITGATAVLSGWGIPSIHGRPNVQLHATRMKILPKKQCGDLWGKRIMNGGANNQICAKNRMGIGGCFGDSGSALVIGNEVAGIVSFGSEYCNGRLPDVYTDVYEMLPFIKDIVQKEQGKLATSEHKYNFEQNAFRPAWENEKLVKELHDSCRLLSKAEIKEILKKDNEYIENVDLLIEKPCEDLPKNLCDKPPDNFRKDRIIKKAPLAQELKSKIFKYCNVKRSEKIKNKKFY